MVRIKQSLEALCYCVLAAQKNVRHSIVGVLGLEAHRQFVKLVDDVVRIADVSVFELRVLRVWKTPAGD